MDDFVISNLYEARNEWCSRLVSVFTPLVTEGIRSIFNEAWNMCQDTDEVSKYLMTFQNLLSRVPKWNSVIVEEERKRIIERSGCNYLEDLITCVHIIQLKVLTCVRVGNRQKKIDISIPKLDHFIHKVYIHVARKVYMNAYLFEKYLTPLQVQKNARELEILIQECILTTIRESIPTEEIIRAYMEESLEYEEEISIEPIVENTPTPTATVTTTHKPVYDEKPPPIVPNIEDLPDQDEAITTRLSFNDVDTVLDGMDQVLEVEAPKSIERLEEISLSNALQRKMDEEAEEEENRLQIGEDVDLGQMDVLDVNGSKNHMSSNNAGIPLLDVEELF